VARDAMNVFKAHAPGLGATLYLQLGARIMGFGRLERLIQREMAKGVEAGKSHPFLSNLGVLDEKRLRFEVDIADAYLVGPALYPPAFMLSASSFREQMIFTCGFCDAAHNRQIYARFFDLFMNVLPA
jgi:NRPS condensation-like uncharacterized protein